MWKWLTLGSISAAAAATALYFIKRRFSGGICYCTERLDGKVVIVTGTSSGIGREAAYIFAERGATLILACRDWRQGEDYSYELGKYTINLDTICFHLDLTSFKNINKFVRELVLNGYIDVYALINNAGVFYHPFQLTEDGFDITFQTNYLGPFYLTVQLLNKKILKPGSRIINIASEAHRFPKTLNTVEVAQPRPELDQFLRYGESKLCLVLFGNKLTSLQKGLEVYNVNPGNVETRIFRHYTLLSNQALRIILKPLRWLLVKTPKQGAQTVVHVTLSPKSECLSGNYFSDCKVDTPSQLALDEKLANSLWDNSLKWCKLDWEG